MKTLKLIIAAVACVAVIYSCKTNSVAPTTTTSTDAVAAQIALSLSKSFSGQYGGANINQGIKSPYSIKHNGVAINGIYDLCGTGIDTTFNTTTFSVAHDTTKVNTGHFKFIYTCGSTGVTGYNVADSIANAFGGATFYNTNAVAQNYVVQALDNTYSLISVGGTIGTTAYVSVLNSAKTTTEYHKLVSSYIFNNVQSKITNGVGDFTQGTASYNTDQTDYAAQYGNTTNLTHYHGLITYLGNHMCTISIQINNIGATDTYLVNMATGAMTKQ
jgi:hypothetical protein